MGPVELVGWMILGGFLGFVSCSLALNALGILLNALGFHPPALGEQGGMAIFALFVMIGIAPPIVVFGRGRHR